MQYDTFLLLFDAVFNAFLFEAWCSIVKWFTAFCAADAFGELMMLQPQFMGHPFVSLSRIAIFIVSGSAWPLSSSFGGFLTLWECHRHCPSCQRMGVFTATIGAQLGAVTPADFVTAVTVLSS